MEDSLFRIHTNASPRNRIRKDNLSFESTGVRISCHGPGAATLTDFKLRSKRRSDVKAVFPGGECQHSRCSYLVPPRATRLAGRLPAARAAGRPPGAPDRLRRLGAE